MKKDSLAELTKMVRKSFAHYDKQGTKHWTWETTAKDLPYQVGSLSKVILQLKGERWAEGKSKAALQADLRDELADILAEVLFIASELKIDLGEAIDEMVNSDSRKIHARTGKK